MTDLVMSNEEMTSIIGARAEQLSHGCDPLIDVGNVIDPILIAQIELKERKLPINVVRKFPTGRIEEISVTQFRYLPDLPDF